MALLRLNAIRLRAALQRPSGSFWIGSVLPALLVAAGVAAVGRISDAQLQTTQDGVTLGVLIGAPLAFVTYTILFRGGDDAFLRRMGVSPLALIRERALRLAGCGAALVGFALLLYGINAPFTAVVVAATSAMLAAWGAGLLAFGAAAVAMTRREAAGPPGCLAMGIKDPEVAGAAPLVYAPLLPLISAGVAGGVGAGVPGDGWLVLAAVAILALGAGHLGGALSARALPRFAPLALEMSFAPMPDTSGGELRARRGVARWLPRRVAAVWARDAAVIGRRFTWASRITWPVVIFSLVALARWGQEPGTRAWVISAVVMVLLLQGAAAIAMGRYERRGLRWVDRAVGLGPGQRFLGRWAWGWGISFWLTVPVGLGWSWWAGAGSGWSWIAAAAGTSGVAAALSVAAGGTR